MCRWPMIIWARRQQLDRDEVLARLQPLLEDDEQGQGGPEPEVRRQCAGQSRHYSARHRFDTMLESYVLDSTGTRHDMDSLALKYLGRRLSTLRISPARAPSS